MFFSCLKLSSISHTHSRFGLFSSKPMHENARLWWEISVVWRQWKVLPLQTDTDSLLLCLPTARVGRDGRVSHLTGTERFSLLSPIFHLPVTYLMSRASLPWRSRESSAGWQWLGYVRRLAEEPEYHQSENFNGIILYTILILMSVQSLAMWTASLVTSSDESAMAFEQSIRSFFVPPSPRTSCESLAMRIAILLAAATMSFSWLDHCFSSLCSP